MGAKMLRSAIIFLVGMVGMSNGQLYLDDDGNLGVNFFGYHAAVGLGGLLKGDASRPGLHVEAGTPFGQTARAGLGAVVKDDGTLGGKLYAGASAGGGVEAAAGLGGNIGNRGAEGALYSGAKAGGVGVVRTLGNSIPAVPASSSGSGSSESLSVEKEVEAVQVKPRRLTRYEKQVAAASSSSDSDEPFDTVLVKEKRVLRPRKLRKYAYLATAANPTNDVPILVKQVVKPAPAIIVSRPGPDLMTNLFNIGNAASGDYPAPPKPLHVVPVVPADTVPDGVLVQTKGGAVSGSLFDDIFNIPISTLRAVSQLVSNIVSGTSVSVTKGVAVVPLVPVKNITDE